MVLSQMMKMKSSLKNKRAESGNVLFLILIAVALFAALSYAVTQSSRSGGGDANNETNLISSAALTQYPASIRTAIIRMMVSNGVDDEELEFNAPDAFDDCTTDEQCVFHPSGGGATYVQAPADVMVGNTQGTWTFSSDFEVINVGISEDDDDATGNEIIAFLPGIREAVCDRINEELGFGATPVLNSSVAGADPGTAGYLRIMDNDPGGIADAEIVLGTGGAAGSNIANFDGEAFGCFEDTDGGSFVYYHVLIER